MVNRLFGPALLAVGLIAAPVHAANVLVNGDFEQLNPDGSIKGWTVVTGGLDQRIIERVKGRDLTQYGQGDELRNNFIAFGRHDIPTDGINEDASGRTGAYIEQTFQSIADATYTLNFDTTVFGGWPPSYKLQYYVFEMKNGREIWSNGFSHSVRTASNMILDFRPALYAGQELRFYGTGNVMGIRFSALGPSASRDVLLDNVVIDGPAATVAGVPEPMTWAMMLAGFGVMGGMMRRHRPGTLRIRFA